MAFAVVLIAGVAAAIISFTGSSTPPATASFGLIGGEDVNDLDGLFGWTFAGEDLITINSPGPTLEVEVGTEVTVTFTNRSGWSDTSPRDTIAQSFRIVATIPSASTLFGADTGLIEVVGDVRYLSDGLGMAARGMFGRFVVTEAADPDTPESGVVGTWGTAGTTLELAADGTFSYTSVLGTTTGTYEYLEAGADPLLVMTSEESSISNVEFDGPCTGEDFLIVTQPDAATLQLTYEEGFCDMSWPGFITLTRAE